MSGQAYRSVPGAEHDWLFEDEGSEELLSWRLGSSDPYAEDVQATGEELTELLGGATRRPSYEAPRTTLVVEASSAGSLGDDLSAFVGRGKLGTASSHRGQWTYTAKATGDWGYACKFHLHVYPLGGRLFQIEACRHTGDAASFARIWQRLVEYLSLRHRFVGATPTMHGADFEPAVPWDRSGYRLLPQHRGIFAQFRTGVSRSCCAKSMYRSCTARCKKSSLDEGRCCAFSGK